MLSEVFGTKSTKLITILCNWYGILSFMHLIILKAWQQSAITKQKGGLFY